MLLHKDVAILLLLTVGAVCKNRATIPPWKMANCIYLRSKRRLTRRSTRSTTSSSCRMLRGLSGIDWWRRRCASSHLPFDYVIFFWHIACIFALLLACWRVSLMRLQRTVEIMGKCFFWSTSLLTIPVAGTALYIMDQYLTPRFFSTFRIMLEIADALEGKTSGARTWIVLLALIHPLMSMFGIALLLIFYIEDRRLAKPGAAPPKQES